jgi:hypothetical protein
MVVFAAGESDHKGALGDERCEMLDGWPQTTDGEAGQGGRDPADARDRRMPGARHERMLGVQYERMPREQHERMPGVQRERMPEARAARTARSAPTSNSR